MEDIKKKTINGKDYELVMLYLPVDLLEKIDEISKSFYDNRNLQIEIALTVYSTIWNDPQVEKRYLQTINEEVRADLEQGKKNQLKASSDNNKNPPQE